MGTDSNFRQMDDDPPFGLDIERTHDSAEWELSLTDPEADAQTYVFTSSVERRTPDPGERIVDVRFSVAFEEDRLFGGEQGGSASLRLEYGDDADGREE